MEWQPIETAPEGRWIIGWLHLPKNPQASAPMVVKRLYAENREVPAAEVVGGGEATWWAANGMYYGPEHVTHWMPLPDAPVQCSDT